MNATQAVLFDLDDTLVDFQYLRRAGLRVVQEWLSALGHLPLEELDLDSLRLAPISVESL